YGTVGQFAVQLLRFDGVQNVAEHRARLQTSRDQIVSRHQRLRVDFVLLQFTEVHDDTHQGFETEAGHADHFVLNGDLQSDFNSGLPHHSLRRRWREAEAPCLLDRRNKEHARDDLFLLVVAQLQRLTHLHRHLSPRVGKQHCHRQHRVLRVELFKPTQRAAKQNGVHEFLWEHMARQPRGEQRHKPLEGKRSSQQLEQLHCHSLAADVHHLRGVTGDRLERLSFDVETELSRKANSTHHSQGVLGEPLVRVPDAADKTVLHVLHTADEIHDAVTVEHGNVLRLHTVDFEVHRRRQEQAVHGEVAACYVLTGTLAKLNCVGSATVAVVAVCTVGSNLDLLVQSSTLGITVNINHDNDHAETRTHRQGLGEDRLHLLGESVRGHVEILGLLAEDHVTHAAAHEESFEAFPLERLDDRRRCESVAHLTRFLNIGPIFIVSKLKNRCRPQTVQVWCELKGFS